ncbi:MULTISPECIES: aquaporin [Streptomycetaceae]|uniref:Putative aquaporin Z n=1 Tax=Streptantibioticus cattleyicolor (strain ATCC 35852 / DSM 46488 / JCM 4925 / NBRC 14057 / NRRL 8057) TaxID=1003195 RepID=F8K2Q2_STREN|nr:MULTISPECIES: aquaporin [Streptomycetaceae]AEW97565.1 putative aquaporin Z [Streptantibioticus cattleyicolor NRRL 8057 = DSM 46488]MYS61997.1 aquaporin [Streptomyces sp. SID5468]CCB77890.1 Aquaporin Z [Streptantibioticus cattleyicolor NRRL 8057 = DSM 46488]
MDRPAVAGEFLGTLLLVFVAVGAAVLAGEYIGTLGIALAFGLTLLALGYVVGPVSGCHLNPAVTLGTLLAGRLDVRRAAGYWGAQLLGAVTGAALLYLVVRQVPGLRTQGAFGSNGYADRSAVGIGAGGAFLAELVLTFLLVYVVLAVTRRTTLTGSAVLPYAAALAAVHLVGAPLTGTSVNPARSLGPALFAGGAALTQLWLFVVAPLAGAALAALAYRTACSWQAARDGGGGAGVAGTVAADEAPR